MNTDAIAQNLFYTWKIHSPDAGEPQSWFDLNADQREAWRQIAYVAMDCIGQHLRETASVTMNRVSINPSTTH